MDFDRIRRQPVFVEDQYDGGGQPHRGRFWTAAVLRAAGRPAAAAPVQAACLRSAAGKTGTGTERSRRRAWPRSGRRRLRRALLDLSAPPPRRSAGRRAEQEAVAELINPTASAATCSHIDPSGSQAAAARAGAGTSGWPARTWTSRSPPRLQRGRAHAALREIVARLKRTYCRTIGVEFMHGEDRSSAAGCRSG